MDADELAEERRLAYVGLTRARERLYVSRAAMRASWGAPQHFPASRFLGEIPVDLIDWKRAESATAQYRTRSSWQSDADSGWGGPGIGAGRGEIGRAHVCTPVTWPDRMPSSACKKI